MTLERRIGNLPNHEVIIAPRKEIALFSGRLPLTKAIRENRIREFERKITSLGSLDCWVPRYPKLR